MAMVALQCPQCGASLDAGALQRGLVRCGSCEAWSLLASSRDHMRHVQTLQVASLADEADLRERVTRHLAKAGIQPVPGLVRDTERVRYIGRRGRVRTTPYGTESARRYDEHEEVRDGVFAIPLDESTDAGLLYLEDVERLEPATMEVPADLDDQVLIFEDRIERVVRDDREARLARASGVRTRYRWESTCRWHEEVVLIDVPLAVYRFELTDTRDTWGKAWRDTRADGQYEVALSVKDGRILRSRIPRRGTNFKTIVVAFILVVFVLPTVATVVATLVAMVVSLVLALLPLLFL